MSKVISNLGNSEGKPVNDDFILTPDTVLHLVSRIGFETIHPWIVTEGRNHVGLAIDLLHNACGAEKAHFFRVYKSCVYKLKPWNKDKKPSARKRNENRIPEVGRAAMYIWINSSGDGATFQNLYDMLMRKKRWNYTVAADALMQSREFFKNLVYPSQSEEDFVLVEDHVQPITDILNIQSLSKWMAGVKGGKGVCMDFLRSASEMDKASVLQLYSSSLEKSFTSPSVEGVKDDVSQFVHVKNLVKKTIQVWISTLGVDATFSQFVRILWHHPNSAVFSFFKEADDLLRQKKYLKSLAPIPPIPEIPRTPYSFLEANFEFDPKKPIGQGGYGKVFRVRRKLDWKVYAIKYFQRLKEGKNRECELLQSIPQHENIIRYYFSWTETNIAQYENNYISSDPEKLLLFIQMEYCEGGDLRQWLNEQASNQENHDKIEKYRREADLIFPQLVSALVHIHGIKPNAVLHRDIKPENILLQNGLTKLGDFGLAREIDKIDMTIRVGSQHYRAPELQIRKLKPYDQAVDIYSTGKIYYELYAGDFSFQRDSSKWRYYMDKVEEFEFCPGFEDAFPDKVAFIKSMLSTDPAMRPRAEQIASLLSSNVSISGKQNKMKQD